MGSQNNISNGKDEKESSAMSFYLVIRHALINLLITRVFYEFVQIECILIEIIIELEVKDRHWTLFH